MGFDGPVRPFGPDVRVETHGAQAPHKIQTDQESPP
jgi:hypothetical protein